MSAGINRYKTDLRELFFTLFEQFGFGQVAGKAPYEAWGPDEAKAVLQETYRFAREVLGPLNASGDREGCRLENGAGHHPQGLQGRLEEALRAGLQDAGGEPGPRRAGRAR